MTGVPNQAMKRAEYLRNKAAIEMVALCLAGARFICLIVGLLFIVVGCAILVALIIFAVYEPSRLASRAPSYLRACVTSAYYLLAGLGLLVLTIYGGRKLVAVLRTSEKLLSYVPAPDEHIAALSSNEVRVGADRQSMRDRVKQRQRYLKQRTLVGVVGLVSSGITLACVISATVLMFDVILIRSSSGSIFLLLGLGMALYGTRRLAQILKTSQDFVPYVPPIREQIASLAAAEILVRGAEQPRAANDELLRAADKGTETAAAELLRPDDQG